MSKNNKFVGLRKYGEIYGGWGAVLKSSYFWWSVVLAVVLFPLWITQEPNGGYEWVSMSLTIIPSMVSFSLGSMAIILSMGGGKFLKVIQSNGEEGSFYLKMVSTFMHFIIVQFVALLATLLAEAYPYFFTSALGFFALIYAGATGIAAASIFMELAHLRNAMSPLEDDGCCGKCRNCDCKDETGPAN